MLQIHVDGATGGNNHGSNHQSEYQGGYCGIAAVARTTEGYFLGWLSRRLSQMTNNEAEYRAALLGLRLAQTLRARQVEIISDSEVMVRQMTGHSRVNSPRLKLLHQQAVRRAAHFQVVRFRHVPREENALADALAAEALNGRLVTMPTQPAANNWWQQLMRFPNVK